jgi:hypothetical protein
MSNTRTVCALARKDVFRAEKMLQDMGAEPHAWRQTQIKRLPHSSATREVVVPAASYVAAKLSNAYKRHVLDDRGLAPIALRVLGMARDDEIERFTSALIPQPPTKAQNPFAVGQPVSIGEVAGTVAATDGEMCSVAVSMLGKLHLKIMHYSRLRPG